MTRALLISALALALVSLGTGCGSDDATIGEGATASPTDDLVTFPEPGRIDEVAGTYRGVGIGDSVDDMVGVFGEQEPAGESEAGTPLRYPNGGDNGPWVIAFGDYDQFGPSFRYYDAAFDFSGAELGALTVVEPGAETSRGVKIGDQLEEAEEAYRELVCGTVNEESEYEPYPACTGQLAPGRYVWFGGDPITSVALSTHELGGL